MGNLGADPDKRVLPDGTVVVNLSIACSEKWKDKITGEIKENTEWVRAAIFGKRAEVVAEHFKKGNQIYVQGKMRTRSYEKDGVKHWVTEIMVNDFQFCGNRPGGDNTKAQQQAEAYGAGANFEAPFDNDIPF
jgi:single-strand DNA-binding protein